MQSVFKMFATTAFAVGVMLIGNTSAEAQSMEPVEIFTNGSMTGETGGARLPVGWSLAEGTCDTIEDGHVFLGSPEIASSSPDGGTFFSCIGYPSGDIRTYESFKQTITVDSGTEYTISFYAANFGGLFGWISAPSGAGSWEVVLDGEVIATSAALPVAAGWTTVTATFTASSATHEIEFRAKHADDDLGKRVFLQIDGLSAMTTEDYNILNPPADNTAPVGTFGLANGATELTRDGALTLTFDEAVRLLDGTAPTTENIAELITFKDTNGGGEDIPFNVNINGNMITIVPSSRLDYGQTVYAGIGATLEDASDNAIAPTNATFTVASDTGASEFANYENEIRQTIVNDAGRSLRSGLAANRRMVQDARSRFADAQGQVAGCLDNDDGRISDDEFCSEIAASSRNIPLDVDGNFTLSEGGLSTAGNFFQQVGNEEGTYRRLFFGDFDVQHDNDTDSTTATLTGRMAWEHMTSEQTMLGYFIGGELATSTIGGSFEGEQDRIGVTAGGYVVHELSELVYFDGFASVGAGRNNLEMANDTLALESEYTTQTATLGGAITGVYSQKGYDFKPELAFSYGRTWLGDIGFTGRAYGLVDNTLSLDAGYVSIASLTFRPEVIIPIGADFVADTNTQLSFAPRLVCEQIKTTTKTSDCGTGGELGFSSTSEDGLSSTDMRVLLDRINGGTRSSFVFSVEHKF